LQLDKDWHQPQPIHDGVQAMPLLTASRFSDPDQAFVTLIEARRGLAEREASALDARLVLILANHIGDIAVLREAIALAKQAGSST
jgi:hypothetical protein